MFKPNQALRLYVVSLILPSCLCTCSGIFFDNSANNMTGILTRNFIIVSYNLGVALVLASFIKLTDPLNRNQLIYSRTWYGFYSVIAAILSIVSIFGLINGTTMVADLESKNLYDLEGYIHFGQMLFAWFTGCFSGIIVLSIRIWWLISKQLQSHC